jgi:hypothetical protein
MHARAFWQPTRVNSLKTQYHNENQLKDFKTSTMIIAINVDLYTHDVIWNLCDFNIYTIIFFILCMFLILPYCFW